MYIVPVTITATPAGTPEPVQRDAELWITEQNAPQEQLVTKTTTAAPAPLVGTDQIAYLKSLHEMSLQTLGQIIKSANEALGKVAQAQSEALRAMSSHHAQAQQSFERMGSLPMKIFERSNEQVEALVAMAQDRASVKHGESAQPKDVMSELKEIMGLVNLMKGGFEEK